MNLISVVKFKVKPEFEDAFIESWKSTPRSNANFSKLIVLEDSVYVSISELPDISDAVQDEEAGIPWLDTVEHMLVKFGDSRTDAYSGLVVAGYEKGVAVDQ